MEERRTMHQTEQRMAESLKREVLLNKDIERQQSRVESKSVSINELGLQKQIEGAKYSGKTESKVTAENEKLKEYLSQYELQIKDLEQQLKQLQ